MNKEAGKQIENARKRRGLTQEKMAEMLAKALKQTYSQRQYQKLEEGNFPKYKKEVIKEVDKILGLNISELIYEQDVPRETGTFVEDAGAMMINNQVEIMATNRVILGILAEVQAPIANRLPVELANIYRRMVKDEAEQVRKELKLK